MEITLYMSVPFPHRGKPAFNASLAVIFVLPRINIVLKNVFMYTVVLEIMNFCLEGGAGTCSLELIVIYFHQKYCRALGP